MSKEREIEKLYHRLALDLRSAIHKPNNVDDCKCLVRFHNCTPYNVQPFWIDSKGLPIKYRPLPRGASMNMDTYESHLWFFKTLVGDNVNRGTNPNHSEMIKLLAVPEEILDTNSGFPQLNKYFKDPSRESSEANSRNSEVQEAILGMNNVLICSLCNYVVRNYSREPAKVPCPHFTGEAKFSVSDMTYIYSCTTKAHRRDHSIIRRNIYLVEPFYSLRERCFLALRNHIRNSDLTEMNLPVSLQEDYIQFMTTLKKVNESEINSQI